MLWKVFEPEEPLTASPFKVIVEKPEVVQEIVISEPYDTSVKLAVTLQLPIAELLDPELLLDDEPLEELDPEDEPELLDDEPELDEPEVGPSKVGIVKPIALLGVSAPNSL